MILTNAEGRIVSSNMLVVLSLIQFRRLFHRVCCWFHVELGVCQDPTSFLPTFTLADLSGLCKQHLTGSRYVLLIISGTTLQVVPAKSRNLDEVISRDSYQPKLLYIFTINSEIRKYLKFSLLHCCLSVWVFF